MSTGRQRLLVGTKNRNKAAEIQRLLADLPVEVVDLSAFPDVPDAVEEGDTFEANAAHKALFFAQATGLMTVADDSGLEVDALGGGPGVYSARFAGENATDEDNNRLLLLKLEGLSAEDRTARFRCVIAFASPEKVLFTTEGTVEGHIIGRARGTYGFGYDPLFQPEGHDKTFGELGPPVKDGVSHRARALAEFKKRLREYLR